MDASLSSTAAVVASAPEADCSLDDVPDEAPDADAEDDDSEPPPAESESAAAATPWLALSAIPTPAATTHTPRNQRFVPTDGM
ncbi:hypothetical protein H7K45_13435 [Mycobacterium yunnanensis]|uniref:Uncharacterized protein n=1 Tax=Mycobacterium yunnanensis TaxID=368477 RepID=A0A9X2YLE0_9MYCO|nr:hypothetical protein [Mycobacterium yunnanensis]MCV7421543.1 hypothetical protein [Mycobacterium yunnanensis]